MSMQTKGFFITVEGIDGAGKSTHIDFLASLLREYQKEVVLTREPGGTALGEQLRSLLLHQKMNLETEALLMFAARKEHLEQVIEPALKLGKWVISDRFTDASFAYQGAGRGLSREKLMQLEQWVHPHLQPDLTFLFDVEPEIASQRLEATRTKDKFESEQISFFERVRAEYLQRATQFSNRFYVINSRQTIQEIQIQLKNIILQKLK